MIEISGQPAINRMTVIAGVARRDVADIFPLCDRVVVATCAGSGNLQMVDRRGRGECRDRMTIFADVRA